MSKRFSKKRVKEGRVEVYDTEHSSWVALAMVPMADRAGLNDLEMEAPPPEQSESITAKQRLDQFDAGVLLGSDTGSKPRSRTTGRLLGLIVGIGLVAVLVLLTTK